MSSKILMYSGVTTGVTTNGDQYAFFINENGIPTVKNGSQVTTFGTSGYAMQGSSGSSGANGSSGLSGTSGISGTSGQDGAPGDIGPGGSSGSSGESGTSGINGVNGIDGASGTSGISYGTSGSSGESGATGSAGTSGVDGSAGVGIPSGGTMGQVLAKATDNNYDTEWVDQTGGGGALVSRFYKFGTGVGHATNNDGPYTFFNNISIAYPFYAIAGYKLSAIEYIIKTAFTNGAFQMAIYDNQQINPSLSRATYGDMMQKNRLTNVITCPNDTTGLKSVDVSSLNFTFPYTGVYFIMMNVPGSWTGAIQQASPLAFSNATNTGLAAGYFMTEGQSFPPIRNCRTNFPVQATYSDSPDQEPSSSAACIILKTTE